MPITCHQVLPLLGIGLAACAPLGAAEGLRGRYYADLAGGGAPLIERIDPSVDFSWGAGAPAPTLPADEFMVVWDGTVQAPTSGSWIISLDSDDGVLLAIDGQVVINDWSDHAVRTANVTVSLDAGRAVPLHLAYYERRGQATVRMQWEGPGTARQIIPASALHAPAALEAEIPASSATSPVCIEIANRTGKSLVVTPGVPALRALGDDHWAAEVTLLPIIDRPLAIAAGPTRISGKIGWSRTALAGPELLVRRGDALLFEMPADGVLDVLHQSGFLFSGLPVRRGWPIPVRFTTAGGHQVRLRTANGTPVALREVVAVASTFTRPIASEIGFARPVRPQTVPLAADEDVVVTGGGPGGSVALSRQADGLWPVIALRHGHAHAVVRLGDANGPILDAVAFDTYTIRNDFIDGFIYARDAQGFGHGTFSFRMTPPVRYLSIDVEFFVPTATVDGKTRFTVPATALDVDGGWSASFVLIPGSDRTCSRLTVTQP